MPGRLPHQQDLGLRSGFESPDLDRPGRLPHHWQQPGLCEARLGRDGSPQLWAPGPGLLELEWCNVQALQTIARQTTRAEWGAACKGLGGWVECYVL